MSDSTISYERFLEEIESPQFKKNAKEIYSYLQQSDADYRLLHDLERHLALDYIRIYRARQELLFLKETKESGRVVTKQYMLDDEELIKTLMDMTETRYLNTLSDLEFRHRLITRNRKQVDEIMDESRDTWSEDPNAETLPLEEFIDYYFSKNEIRLYSPKFAKKHIVSWVENVIDRLPYHDAVAIQGRPFSMESIKMQITQIESALDSAAKLMTIAEDEMINGFIESLLKARVKRDNSLYRDVYYTLQLFNRIPDKIVETHCNNEATNRYIRENYIKKKFEKIIDGNIDYQIWYRKPRRVTGKNA